MLFMCWTRETRLNPGCAGWPAGQHESARGTNDRVGHVYCYYMAVLIQALLTRWLGKGFLGLLSRRVSTREVFRWLLRRPLLENPKTVREAAGLQLRG